MIEKVFAVAGHISSDAEMRTTMMLPKFRKATRAMGYTFAAVRALTDRFPALTMPEVAHRVGIVVGSSHGELDVTTQFLDHIGKTNTARPILFQNSLHNSTLGFLTVELQVTGAAMTVSNGQFSGEDAIDTATVLLRAGDCDICLAIGYDLLVPAVEGVRNRFYPAGLVRGEGAAAVLLATEVGLRHLGAPVAEFVSLIRERNHAGSVVEDCDPVSQPFYDANGIADFVRYLTSDTSEQPLVVHKPDGSLATFKIRRM